jgi:DNA-directed RNA polymerase sigma subunit (sigma70/sigma32)
LLFVADRERTPARELAPVTIDTFGECELAALEDRTAHILRMRSGMMGERHSQAEVAEELGVSREWIRQLENEGLMLIGKMRAVDRHLVIPPPRKRGRYVWRRLAD